MYFADDPGCGISAYALHDIAKSTPYLSRYTGGEGTSRMMMEASHYSTHYGWSELESQISLDARFPGSAAARLINDDLVVGSDKETNNIELRRVPTPLGGWDVRAVIPDHAPEVIQQNVKLTTRYSALYWCDSIYPSHVIRAAERVYGYNEVPREQWNSAVSLAKAREASAPEIVPEVYLEIHSDDDPAMEEELDGLDDDHVIDIPPPPAWSPPISLYEAAQDRLDRGLALSSQISQRSLTGASSEPPLEQPSRMGNGRPSCRPTVASRTKSSSKRNKLRTRARKSNGGDSPLDPITIRTVDPGCPGAESVDSAPAAMDPGMSAPLPLQEELYPDWRIEYSDRPQIRVGYWNLNGLPYSNYHAPELMIEAMKTRGLSVMCMTDARLTAAAGKWFSHRVKKSLPGSAVCVFPTTKEQTRKVVGSKGNTDGKRGVFGSHSCMGGTVVIVDPSLAPFLTNTRADPTGTGLVTALEFARNGHRFVIISAYLPPYASENTPESTKLHSRIRRYLKSKGITGQSHRAFLQMIIDKWVSAYEA
jgi:hypothetical protein